MNDRAQFDEWATSPFSSKSGTSWSPDWLFRLILLILGNSSFENFDSLFLIVIPLAVEILPIPKNLWNLNSLEKNQNCIYRINHAKLYYIFYNYNKIENIIEILPIVDVWLPIFIGKAQLLRVNVYKFKYLYFYRKKIKWHCCRE